MKPETLLEAMHVAERLKDTTRHCYTSGGGIHIVNPKSLTLKKSAFTVKIGKTAQIRATVKGTRSGNILNHDHKLRYYSSDKKVAKVTSTGRIKAAATAPSRNHQPRMPLT